LPRALLEVAGPGGRLPFALLPRPEPVDATIRSHGVETTHLPFPPLTLLDASDRAVVSLAGYRDLLRTAGGGKKRSGGKVVGKPITTPTTAAASPSQVPVTN
jgi:hypothetical protein